MQFMMTTLPAGDTPGPPPTPEMMVEMGKLIDEMRESGVLVATGGLLPVSMGGTRVQSTGGKFTVVDGPYAESKELIAGFALVNVNSLEEAIELSRRFFAIGGGGDGHGEIRRIMGPDDDFNP